MLGTRMIEELLALVDLALDASSWQQVPYIAATNPRRRESVAEHRGKAHDRPLHPLRLVKPSISLRDWMPRTRQLDDPRFSGGYA